MSLTCAALNPSGCKISNKTVSDAASCFRALILMPSDVLTRSLASIPILYIEAASSRCSAVLRMLSLTEVYLPHHGKQVQAHFVAGIFVLQIGAVVT